MVNTASINGILPSPGLGPYNVAKAGVVALSENLKLELEAAGAPVGVSVLCPAVVATRISTSDRNRRDRVVPGPAASGPRPLSPIACAPADVAAAVERAVREDRFWIVTHPQFDRFIVRRAVGIVACGSPCVARVT